MVKECIFLYFTDKEEQCIVSFYSYMHLIGFSMDEDTLYSLFLVLAKKKEVQKAEVRFMNN